MQKTLVLGGGCFWCTEAIFKELNGVTQVKSGYAGGTIENPNYSQVTRGKSGAAEVIQITYDQTIISLDDLLRIFFTLHNPTTKNQQGADIGTEYRSVIFYNDEVEKETATKIIREIEQSKIWSDPIITSLEPLEEFYPAEDYHQNYYALNADKPYCQIVIEPKVAKLRKMFRDKLKRFSGIY